MKINLLYGEGDVLTGYTNLHPFAKEETEHLRIADVKNLDRFVENAEATEIIATDVIDYLMLHEIDTIIKHWITKLRIGGKIVLGGTDLHTVSKAFANYTIDVDAINMLLHGSQTEPHLVKRVNLTLTGLCTFLNEACGLKIIKRRMAGYNYLVEAHRV